MVDDCAMPWCSPPLTSPSIEFNSVKLRVFRYLLNYSNLSKNPKEKSLCYNTLAEIFNPLDESFIKDYVKTVLKNIIDELQQKNKPLCTETIKCFENLTMKLMKK